MNDRLSIKERSIDVDLYDVFSDRTIDEAIDALDILKETYVKDHHTIVMFSIEPYGYDGAVEISLDLYREETDREYEARIQEEKRAQEKKEQARLRKLETKIERDHLRKMTEIEREKAEYERLKAKYG